MRTLAADAIDRQIELASYYATDEGRTAMRSASIACLQIAEDAAPEYREMIELSAGEFGVRAHRGIVVAGETFAVSADVLTVLQAAAGTMPSYRLAEMDLPTETGFVWFETPLVLGDHYDKPVVTRAIGWQRVKVASADDPEGDHRAGLFLVSWTNPFDERDALCEQWLEIRAANNDYFPDPPNGLWSLPSTWLFGEHSQDGICNVLAAFFRFVDQTFVSATRTHPGRPAARRAAKAKINDTVKIIHLRRREASQGDGESEANRNYDHRWLVRGHWRNQWYPSVNDHRPIWIAEHVKGPEDAPLVVKDHIFLVDR